MRGGCIASTAALHKPNISPNIRDKKLWDSEKAPLFDEDEPHLFLRIIHLAGAMGSLQTVLPFKLAATGKSLTAHGGLALYGEYLRAMGVGELIDHELPRPGSAAGYGPSADVLPLVLMLAGGGRTLEDLRVRRGDVGLRSLLQLEDMPSSDATGDWLRRMGAKESDGLAGLRHGIRALWFVSGQRRILCRRRPDLQSVSRLSLPGAWKWMGAFASADRALAVVSDGGQDRPAWPADVLENQRLAGKGEGES